MSVNGQQNGTARPGSAVPLRGTQSFVGVFTRVWRRPGLLLLELVWRWGTALPLLALLGWALRAAFRAVHLDQATLEAITIYQPAAAAKATETAVRIVVPPLWNVLRWWVPAALLLWTAVGTLGAVAIWRRQDPVLAPAPGAVLRLSLLRSVGLLAAYGLWSGAVWAAWRFAIVGPVAQGIEPNLVLFAALCVGATLALFVGWSLVSWSLDAARLRAMRDRLGAGASLRAAARARVMRSKLVELNLVMGIVRVALLVLAMVAMATPVPFASEAGPTFFKVWLGLVAVVYLIVSDLFQVVRRSAGLYLLRALEP